MACSFHKIQPGRHDWRDSVLDGLAHDGRKSGRAGRTGRNPETASRRHALEGGGVDRQLERKMGKGLLHRPGSLRQLTAIGRAPQPRVPGPCLGPGRARQLDGRGEKAVRRPAASEKGAVGAAGEEHRPLPARSRFRLCAARVGLRAPDWSAAQSGASGQAPQAGLRGRQRVAPISMSAWAKSPALRLGASACAAAASSPRARAIGFSRAMSRAERARCCRRPARSGGRRQSPQSPRRYRRQRPAGRATRLPRSEIPPLAGRSPSRRRADCAPANNSRDRRMRR